MIVLSLAVASMFGSCNFLDVDRYFSDEIKIDSVFNSTRNVEAYMWGITNYFGDEGSIHQNADTRVRWLPTRLSPCTRTLHGYNGLRLVLNEINASNLYSFETMYKNSYIAIRKCNTLFQRIDEAADMTAIDRAEIMATTRFLRAYAYYKILTVFGPPIIVGDEVIPSNEELVAYDCTRSTYDELWSIFARNLRLRPYLCRDASDHGVRPSDEGCRLWTYRPYTPLSRQPAVQWRSRSQALLRYVEAQLG